MYMYRYSYKYLQYVLYESTSHAMPATTSFPAAIGCPAAAHVPRVPPRDDDMSTVPVTPSLYLLIFGAVFARDAGRWARGRASVVMVVVSRGSVGPIVGCRWLESTQ